MANATATAAKNKAAMARGLADLNAVLTAGRYGTRTGIAKASYLLRNNIVTTMKESFPSGRIYIRRTVVHQASAPGQPPAIVSGRYWGSWNVEVVSEGKSFVGLVATSDIRGPVFEFGGDHIAARPHVRPALAKTTAKITQVIAAETAGAIRAKARALKGKR